MHTPTPWNANNIKDDPNDLACAVWDKSGDIPICTGSFSVGKYNEVDAQTKHDNMLFIAQAVNAHEAMIKALDDLRIFAEGIRDEWQNDHPEMEYNPLRLALLERAQAALALAKKGA